MYIALDNYSNYVVVVGIALYTVCWWQYTARITELDVDL